MAETERWGSYIGVMALVMFGIVLFPIVGDFVDVAAISIFWAVKNLEVDPVPSLLADLYYSMSIFHSKEKGSLCCCIPLLYQWFTSHLCKDIHLIETKGNHAWAQKLASLNEGSILWKVTRAWEKRKDISSEESYIPWIKEMVRLIKLPFMIDPSYVPDIPNPNTMSTEEVDRLKDNIARLEQDKESLEHSLYDATRKKNQISYDLE
ncbi:hypothetical protein KIW84_043970 [Lathyrus oleraceus]|uniref:DUF7745 domain-containing protein n=1 Tax=Pisum sativum TaxID=3888 RepID=A0A9D4XF10_PEA|nr:hypothetical protein KIW84_043970 [Pisum sativum]